MSTAAISSNLINSQVSSYFQQRRSDLQQLSKDLQSGNLSAAQQDFSAIQTLAQSGPFANGAAFTSTKRQNDFAAVGQALQSGDLAGAQQAFAQLQSTFQNHHQHTELPPAVVVNIGSAPSTSTSSGAASQPASTTAPAPAQAAAPATSANGPEIVLNLGNATPGEQITIGFNNSSKGEQVTVSVANQQNQAPEQITLNLGQNSNQQIILNLFNSTASQSQSSAVNVTA
jgi:hypothetical protein